MTIIIRIITGVIQDKDNNSYDHVVIVYALLAITAVIVSISLLVFSFRSIDLGNLQWTRKQRISRGDLWNERRERFYGKNGHRNRIISKICFGSLLILILGGWAAYIWGAVTGNNG